MRGPTVASGPPVGTLVLLLIVLLASGIALGAEGALEIEMPDHVFEGPGDFVTIPFTPTFELKANFVTIDCLDDVTNDPSPENFEVAITDENDLVLAKAEITDNFGAGSDCDGHRYSFDVPDTILLAGTEYGLRTTALSGWPIRARGLAYLYHDRALPSHVNTRKVGGLMVTGAALEPPGHVYPNDGSSVVQPLSLPEGRTLSFVTLGCLEDTNNDAGSETFEVALTTNPDGTGVVAAADLSNNLRQTGGCDEHLYLFDLRNSRLSPGVSYYLRTTAKSGAPVRTLGPDHLYFTLAAKINEYVFSAGGHLALASNRYQLDRGLLGENAIRGTRGASTSFRLEDGFVMNHERPGEVMDLEFQDKTTLSWAREARATERGGVYNVYRGLLSQVASGFGSCFQPGVTSTSASDTAVPGTGGGFFYLITSDVGSEEGTMGWSYGRPGDPIAWRERGNTNPCPGE